MSNTLRTTYGWTLHNNEHYARGVDGKDLATYTNSSLDEWYVWGTDMVGKIKGSTKYFFFKDHLGSVRGVIDNNFSLVSAQDFDPWGYLMENRVYNGDSAKHKFTGKERDEENLYDYFGARYYDSRIGRWGAIDPLSNSEPQLTPYHYASNDPINKIDIEGLTDYYFKNGEEVDRQPGEFAWMYRFGVDPEMFNRYYVQSPWGNIQHGGDSYFQALSDVRSYDWRDVIADWESVGFSNRVNEAVNYYHNNKDKYLNVIDYIYMESPKGKLDQKWSLLREYPKELLPENYLYVFKDYALNWREAGNVVWGASMNRFGVSSKGAQFFGHLFTLWTYGQLDQSNEQFSILMGYYNSRDKFKFY